MEEDMKNKPNVIVMFVDDLGYGDVSSFNPEGKIKTDNIDALAGGGMSFTNSHSCAALCTPSRYGLLTGRYSFRSKLKALVLPGDSMPLIEKDRFTMANLFKEAGYATACVGKWHLGLEWQLKSSIAPEDFKNGEESFYSNVQARNGVEPTIRMNGSVKGLDIDYAKPILYGPNQYGFDYFYGMPASLDQAPYVYIENDRVVEEPDYISGVVKFDRRTGNLNEQWQCGPTAKSFKHENVLDDMNEKVLDLIDDYSKQDAPFFIYYPTPAVHSPLLPSKEFAGKSGLNRYADIVLQLDDMVGKISQKLEEKNISDDTIFVFTSDNGCAGVANIPELLAKGHNPSAMYRGYKFSIYEGGHRAPTIVSYPREIRAGSYCDSNICHTDFLATFADLLNISLDEKSAEDSFSNLPLWKENGLCARKATVVTSAAGFFAIIKDQWKLACCEDGGGSREAIQAGFTDQEILQKFELYDLNKTIDECENLYEQYPEVVAQLKMDLSQIVTAGRQTDGVPQENHLPPKWTQINW